jgi:DNA-binding transcriptional LysR family regulator
MDKFESMRAFTQVFVCGSFAAAGRNMGMSRSAVNKLVIALENELGVQLLHRSTRQVTPTETGQAYYERCVEILASVEAAELSLSQLQEQPKGRLRINAPMTFGTLHLAPVLAEFLLQYPELQLQLTLSDRFVDPIEEGFDVTVRIAELQQSSSLVIHPLMLAQRVLCAAPDYLSKQGIPDHPDDLQQHSCLHYGQIANDSHWMLHRGDEVYTIGVRGAMCSNNGEVLRDAAVQGLGITLLPRFIVEPQLQQGQLQIVLPDYPPSELAIYIIYPVNRHLSTKVRLIVEFIQQRLGQIEGSR